MHLFAYGSLVDPRCLDQVLGHPHRGERLAARLADFERVTSDYPYPFIVPAPGGSVDGVLIMDLSADDLAALDRYEDVDEAHYARQSVEVEAWGCGAQPLHMEAFVYVAGPRLSTSTTG